MVVQLQVPGSVRNDRSHAIIVAGLSQIVRHRLTAGEQNTDPELHPSESDPRHSGTANRRRADAHYVDGVSVDGELATVGARSSLAGPSPVECFHFPISLLPGTLPLSNGLHPRTHRSATASGPCAYVYVPCPRTRSPLETVLRALTPVAPPLSPASPFKDHCIYGRAGRAD